MDFVINLKYDRNVPLFRRVSNALRQAIDEGRLSPGDSLPSVRDLSASLKISRATSLKALEVLRADGLLESLPGAGTYLKEATSASSCAADALGARQYSDVQLAKRNLSLSEYGKRIIGLSNKEANRWFNFSEINHGALPIELAPISIWSSLLLDYCRASDIVFGDEAHSNGYPPLLEALSAYLLRARSVHCQASQVILFSTKQLRLDLIARILVAPGDVVVMEEPGFQEARITFESHGATVVPVPVDREGLDVNFLQSLSTPVKLVYVTPSHQDPMGVVLSAERRKRLLHWARAHGAYIIEDDYDSEFRYGKDNLPSLQSSDSECVIYVGSLWKILFPVLRFGFIVVPKHLSQLFFMGKQQLEKYMPTAEQVALAAFINEGYLERHIHKTHKVLTRRRQSLIYALVLHMRDRLTIESETAGTHLVGTIKSPISDYRLEQLASACGLSVMSTARYYALEPKRGELMILFSHVDPQTVAGSVAKWISLISEEENVNARN